MQSNKRGIGNKILSFLEELTIEVGNISKRISPERQFKEEFLSRRD